MSSLTNTQVNARSMNGLVNVEANSGTFDEIDCNTLNVALSATAPTMSSIDNSTHIATTAFVANALTGVSGFMDLTTTQTATGEKTFSNAFTKITGTLNINTFEPSVATASSNIYTGQTSGVLNIATNGSRTGAVNISNGSTATNNINIGNQRSGVGTVSIGSNNSSTNILNLQSSEVNIGTVSPIGTTNDVNIGNGQLGSTIILNSETTCIDDLIVNNIKSTAGSMTIATDPVGYTDDITISSANEVSLNAGYSVNINSSVFGTFTAGAGFAFNAQGTYGMSFNDQYGTGSNGISFNGADVFFNNSNKIDIASSNVNVNGGQLTVNAGPFVIKSGGSERLRVNYALGETTIQIKTDGDTIRFTSSENSLIMEVQDTLGALYKKGSVYVPDSANFSLIPAGTILTSVVSTAPAGYVLCNGTSYSTTASSSNPYYELYLAIGYTFGGSGATFKVPNFQGAFLRGASSQVVGGITYTASAVGTAQQDMALTTPLATYSTPFVSTGFRSCGSGTRDCLARTSQGDTPENPTGLNLAYPSGRGGTEVRPMNYSVYYYIKY